VFQLPSLVEASFGGFSFERLEDPIVRKSFLLQIKVLKLDITQNSTQVVDFLRLMKSIVACECA
jgi:hypothetical protein